MTAGLDVDWLRRRYVQEQAPIAAIAAERGVDVSTVHRALRQALIPPRGAAGRIQWGKVLTHEFLQRKLAASTPIRSIAEEIGCDPVVVRRWLLRHRLTEPVLTVEQRKTLRRMYHSEDLSVAEIARRLQIGTVTARAQLVAAGLVIRPRGRPSGR